MKINKRISKTNIITKARIFGMFCKKSRIKPTFDDFITFWQYVTKEDLK